MDGESGLEIQVELSTASRYLCEGKWSDALAIYRRLLRCRRLSDKQLGEIYLNRATIFTVLGSRWTLWLWRRSLIRDVERSLRLLGYTWYLFSVAANIAARISLFDKCEFYLDAAQRLALDAKESQYCRRRLQLFRQSRSDFETYLNRQLQERGLQPLAMAVDLENLNAEAEQWKPNRGEAESGPLNP